MGPPTVPRPRSPLLSPTLSALAAGAGTPPDPAAEPDRCDLCAAPTPPGHRHLLDRSSGDLLCACTACAVLFDNQAAGGRHYRLVGDRRVRLADFQLDGPLWAALGVPVDLAFFVVSGAPAGPAGPAGSGDPGDPDASDGPDTVPGPGEVSARYPSPAGTLRATVPVDSWQRLVAVNPVLSTLAADIEALVVDQSHDADEHWILPLDDCYRLTALLREHWVGFTGGSRVWRHISDFFDQLKEGHRR